MRIATTLYTLMLVPGLALAQGNAQAGASTQTDAGVSAQWSRSNAQSDSTSRGQAGVTMSSATSVKLAVLRQEARDSQVPEQALVNVVAEGSAKGASEVQIVSAARTALHQMIEARQALIAAGRAEPSDMEIESGAQLIARGATSAELQSLAVGGSLTSASAANIGGVVPVTASGATSVSTAANTAGGMASVTGQAAGALTAGLGPR